MLESVVAYGIIAGARAITGLRSLWLGTTPIPKQRIYYANHSSHGDFVLLWASLPPEVRRRTRPVAGADYWNKAGLRSYVINKVFNGVLVDRQRSDANANPLEPLDRALDGGDSLIIFPEGTRNLDDEVKLLPFKSGIYHLSLAHPEVELVPVWLANLNRVMPKGRMLPLPLLCTLSFGKPLVATAEEGKEAFLERARMAVIGFAFWLGQAAVILLFYGVSFYALREFITLTPTRRSDYPALVAAFYFVLPMQYLLIYIDWYSMFSIFIPVYVFLLLPILASLGGDTKHFLERASKVQWGLMLAVFCISFVPALLTLDIPGFEGRNLLLIAYLVIVVQLSDVMQYICGKLFGKRKIAPNLSPSKTVEGFVGGIALATAIGASLWWITPFNLWQAALIALLINLLGFFGGLVMSAIKRDRGVKDWGHMIEGHGGMLDRLDSVCFAAPIFFHVVRYWWTP